MMGICSSLVNSIKEDLTAKGCVIDPYEHIYLFVINWLSSFLTGYSFKNSDPTFQKWIQMERISVKYAGMADGVELDIMPFVRHFCNRAFKMLQLISKIQGNIFNKLRSDFAEKKRDTSDLKGLFFAMMAENEKKHGGGQPLFDNGVVDNITYEIMVAGKITLIAAIYYTL